MKKVIIVGGGIIGATAAFELMKRKYDVTIVDNMEDGRATSAAAGIICPWISQRRNKAWYELASKGAAFLEQLIEDLNRHGKTETGYKKVGTLRIHKDPSRLEKQHAIALKRRESNDQIGDIKLLSPAETKEKFPLLADHYYSLFISGGARVDGRALRQALTEAAVELGATFINGKATPLMEGKEIVGVKMEEKSHDTKAVTEQNIYADEVILSNGIWMPETLAPLGITLQVKAQKGEIIHLQTDSIETDHLPVIMVPYDQYILSFANGRMVAGATRENDPQNQKKTIGGLNTVLTRALEVAPGLTDSTLAETRVGMRPFTKDNLPVFGKVPQVDRLLLANGLGSSGLSTGPIIGRQLAKMIADEEPDIDWDIYRVEQALE